VEVVFLESARFYWLPAENPDFARILDLLRGEMQTKRVVRIVLENPESDVIRDAHALH